MSESQAVTLAKYAENAKPGDASSDQLFLARLIRSQGGPCFIVWGKGEDQQQPVDVIQEASVILNDNSVFHIETAATEQTVRATNTEAKMLKAFMSNALTSEMASKGHEDLTFEGDWYRAMERVGPEWFAQLSAELSAEKAA